MNESVVRHGRLRPSFFWLIVVFSLLVLAACSADVEPGGTAVLTPQSTSTVSAPEPTKEVVAEPTAELQVAPTEAPATETTIEPTPVPQSSTVAITDDVTFEVVGQYGGVASAVAVAGDVAFVGFGSRLASLDVSDPTSPQLLGITEPLADRIRDIAIINGFAYLAAGRAGLVVVDANDPSIMVITSAGPNYAGKNAPNAGQILVEGDLAFVTDFNRQDGATALVQFNIVDPNNIEFLTSTDIQTNDDVVIDGSRLIIVGNGRIELRDTTDLAEVQSSATLTDGSYATKAIVRDNLVYVLEIGGQAGVELFDISDIQNPTPVGDFVPFELFIGSQVVANDTHLFSVGTFGEFGFCESHIDIIDIRAETPAKVTMLSPGACVTDIFVDDSRLLVSSRGGLKIFDITDPAAPAELSLFTHWDGFQTAEAVARQGDATYILTGEGSGAQLRTVQLLPDGTEVYPDAIPFPSIIVDLIVTDDALIAAEWQGSLFTLDLSNPTTPEIAHDPAEGDPIKLGEIFSYALNGRYLYVPFTDGVLIGGIGIVDLSNPTTPELVSTFETGDYQVMHLVVGNGYLYALVQGQAFSIYIFDISDPAAPQAVGQITMPESTNRLALYENTLYAACDQWNCQSLYAIDVTNPESAEITNQWHLNVGVADMVPAGDGRFYLSTTVGTIWLLDVSDLASPVLAGHIQLPDGYTRLKVYDGLIYAAAFEGGLYLLSVE